MDKKLGRTPAVAFVGRQNSGKTTLVVKLIEELVSRGVDVGSVKHHGHPGFEIDVEGKDSWRHAHAGSSEVAILSPDRFALVRQTEEEMTLQQVLATMAPHDVVLVEGFRMGQLPTVELFRQENPNDEGRTIADSPQLVVAVVTDIEAVREEARALGLPCFGFEDIGGLADFIEKDIMGAAGFITR